MVKHPDGTPGKKPSASSTGRQPTGPMTLGNMRSLGPRDLDVTCNARGYHSTVNVDTWPDEEPVPAFGPLMLCRRCGRRGASVRPDWAQLNGADATKGPA
jgi:hypothetical protein